MERRKFNPEPPREDAKAPQLALFTSAPAPGIERKRFVADDLSPQGVAAFIKSVAAAGLELTDWSRERPPCSGWWEIKQRVARAPDPMNYWYDAPSGNWFRGVPVTLSREARAIPHGQLMGAFEWRGLRAPWPEGYSYELTRARFGQPIMVGDASKLGEIVEGGKIPGIPDLNPTRRRIAL